MKAIILICILSMISFNQANAIVVVGHNSKSSTYQSTEKHKTLVKEKEKSKQFSFKKLFKKIARIFDFDLSDPVDGWLSLAILLFAGALGLALLSWLLGSIYILNVLTTILGIGGFACFIIWVIKAFS